MTREAIEAVIRRYYDSCNEADRDKMLECLAEDAVHYFPSGAPQGPFVGAQAIADGWIAAVERLDSRWTIDRIAVDESTNDAVVEWTHFKPNLGSYLRGDEWFRFSADGRIAEIRAYYACPPLDPAKNAEIGGFDYVNRGYPVTAPEVTRTSTANLAPTHSS